MTSRNRILTLLAVLTLSACGGAAGVLPNEDKVVAPEDAGTTHEEAGLTSPHDASSGNPDDTGTRPDDAAPVHFEDAPSLADTHDDAETHEDATAPDDSGSETDAGTDAPSDSSPGIDANDANAPDTSVTNPGDASPDSSDLDSSVDATAPKDAEPVDAGSDTKDADIPDTNMPDAAPLCTPDSTMCEGDVAWTCNSDGSAWSTVTCPYVCEDGGCGGVCEPGAFICTDNAYLDTCTDAGTWAATTCPAYQICTSGKCASACKVDTNSYCPTGLNDQGFDCATDNPPDPSQWACAGYGSGLWCCTAWSSTYGDCTYDYGPVSECSTVPQYQIPMTCAGEPSIPGHPCTISLDGTETWCCAL